MELIPVQKLNYSEILSFMQSGTTWIGKVLNSSPEVLYLHEPDYVTRILCLTYTTEGILILVHVSFADCRCHLTDFGSPFASGASPS